MDPSSDGVWGAVAVAAATLGSVLVAKISRPRDHEDEEQKTPSPTVGDLTTIAGLAQEMIRLRGRVSELECEQTSLQSALTAQQEHSRLQDERTGALRRYIRRLETALRDLGAAVPDPDPADFHLIRGS
ncbi:hypothetical protein [Kitasatospora sp. NPDC004272]